MAKNVYLQITDIHLAVEKDNRFNYMAEVVNALEQIVAIVVKYKEQVRNSGGKVIAMLMGDVFDGSSNVPEESMLLLEILKYFLSNFDDAYVVVGNHEITYQRDNPFWYMVYDIQDESLAKVRRVIQPKGLQNYFSIPATVEDGEVVFYFNHFGTVPKVAKKGETRIGLFHQNVGSNDISKMWGAYDDVEHVAYVQSYTHCFFGHMHMAKGSYWLNEEHTCRGEWLGSIGRTNVLELKEGSCEVNIPAVIVEDGKFVGIEDNLISLMPYEQCVNEETYEASKKVREELHERKVSTEVNYTGDTLLKALHLRLDNNELGVLFALCAKSEAEMLYEYRQSRDNFILEPESAVEEAPMVTGDEGIAYTIGHDDNGAQVSSESAISVEESLNQVKGMAELFD